MDDKDFYSPKEIAEKLGVKVETVQGWIREKKLPAIKLGNTYRISNKDLQKFLDERRTT